MDLIPSDKGALLHIPARKLNNLVPFQSFGIHFLSMKMEQVKPKSMVSQRFGQHCVLLLNFFFYYVETIVLAEVHSLIILIIVLYQ